MVVGLVREALGFDLLGRGHGERAVDRALKANPDARFEDLLRAALQLVAGR